MYNENNNNTYIPSKQSNKHANVLEIQQIAHNNDLVDKLVLIGTKNEQTMSNALQNAQTKEI